MEPKTIPDRLTIFTHSRNCHFITVYEASSGKTIYEHNGYAPYFVNCAVTGKEKDYFDNDNIHFEIDTETGRIVNWNADLFKKHLEKQIKWNADLLKKHEDESASRVASCLEKQIKDASTLPHP